MKCTIKECKNHSHQVKFINGLCLDCNDFVASGGVGKLRQQLTEANEEIENLKQDRDDLKVIRTELQDNLSAAITIANGWEAANQVLRERTEKAEARVKELETEQVTEWDKVLEQENKRLLALLKVATCPACDGSGAIGHEQRELVVDENGTPEGERVEVEWEQCQWCDEREQALKETENG